MLEPQRVFYSVSYPLENEHRGSQRVKWMFFIVALIFRPPPPPLINAQVTFKNAVSPYNTDVDYSRYFLFLLAPV